jgi:hypothetical protein
MSQAKQILAKGVQQRTKGLCICPLSTTVPCDCDTHQKLLLGLPVSLSHTHFIIRQCVQCQQHTLQAPEGLIITGVNVGQFDLDDESM